MRQIEKKLAAPPEQWTQEPWHGQHEVTVRDGLEHLFTQPFGPQDGALLLAGAAERAATRDKFRLNRLLQEVIARPWVANAVSHRLARRRDLADRRVGIAGDFVPARTALNARFLWDLLNA